MRAMLILAVVFMLSLPPAAAVARWSGVDETVVEKYAEEHGRGAVEPLINTDQGDILLFVFLMAGAVAGFAGGYYYRVLTEKRPQDMGRAMDGGEQKRAEDS